VRALVVTSGDCDYLSACLWDGLQEVLGEANVFDACGCPWLHKSSLDRLCPGGPHPEFYAICGAREGRTCRAADGPFDLLVVHSCFLRDGGWGRLEPWLGRLGPRGKIAYVEGQDAAWHVEAPPLRVDAVFRREVSPEVAYPYACHHLSFAMPARLFAAPGGDRPFDVFFAGNPLSCRPGRPVRWPMLAGLFATRTLHRSLACTGHLGGWEPYYDFLCRSRLALAPPGADDCESLRCYEAAAAGAVPVLVGYPDRVRDPWFPDDACFSTPVEGLPGCLDAALAEDLGPRQAALREHALKHHTTRARAEKLLAVLFGGPA
jgi:hypothetical protein